MKATIKRKDPNAEPVTVILPIDTNMAVSTTHIGVPYNPENTLKLYDEIIVLGTTLHVNHNSFTLTELNNVANLIRRKFDENDMSSHSKVIERVMTDTFDQGFIDPKHVILFAKTVGLTEFTDDIVDIVYVNNRIKEFANNKYDSISDILKYLHVLEFDTVYEYMREVDGSHLEPLSISDLEEIMYDIILELM